MEPSRLTPREKHLLAIGEAERYRLGHELHDGLAQVINGLTLSAVVLAAAVKRGILPSPAELDHLVTVARAASHEVRALTRRFRPLDLGRHRLGPALRELTEQVAAPATAVFEQKGGEPRLDALSGVFLYRIAEETAYSALHLAPDARITITLRRCRGHVVLDVTHRAREPEVTAAAAAAAEVIRHQADLIGARLRRRHLADGASRLRCVLREAPPPA